MKDVLKPIRSFQILFYTSMAAALFYSLREYHWHAYSALIGISVATLTFRFAGLYEYILNQAYPSVKDGLPQSRMEDAA